MRSRGWHEVTFFERVYRMKQVMSCERGAHSQNDPCKSRKPRTSLRIKQLEKCFKHRGVSAIPGTSQSKVSYYAFTRLSERFDCRINIRREALNSFHAGPADPRASSPPHANAQIPIPSPNVRISCPYCPRRLEDRRCSFQTRLYLLPWC